MKRLKANEAKKLIAEGKASLCEKREADFIYKGYTKYGVWLHTFYAKYTVSNLSKHHSSHLKRGSRKLKSKKKSYQKGRCYSIYAIFKRGSKDPVYFGVTSNMGERKKQHIDGISYGKEKLYRRLRVLLQGKKYRFKIVQKSKVREHAESIEQTFIKKYSNRGIKLANFRHAVKKGQLNCCPVCGNKKKELLLHLKHGH